MVVSGRGRERGNNRLIALCLLQVGWLDIKDIIKAFLACRFFIAAVQCTSYCNRHNHCFVLHCTANLAGTHLYLTLLDSGLCVDYAGTTALSLWSKHGVSPPMARTCFDKECAGIFFLYPAVLHEHKPQLPTNMLALMTELEQQGPHFAAKMLITVVGGQGEALPSSAVCMAAAWH